MKKLKTNYIIGSMILSSIISGSAIDYKNINNEEEAIEEAMYEETNDDVFLDEIDSYDSYINYLDNNLITIGIEDIFANPFLYSEPVLCKAAYTNLVNHNITIEEVKDELNNILLQSLYLSDSIIQEEHTDKIKILKSTLPSNLNPYIIYLPLAKKIHEYNCSYFHSYSDCSGLICTDIERDYYNSVFFDFGYLNQFSENDGYQRLVEYYNNNEVKNYELLYELDRIVICYLKNEEYDIEDFPNLSKTLIGDENIIDIYLEIATYVYSKRYPEENIYEIIYNDKMLTRQN